MQITRNTLDTNRGPSEWFTGAVDVDTIAAPSGTYVSDDECAQAPSLEAGDR
ncbi:MAG: hypothetical protein M3322_06180 [Actinomycetota bacterium]|nr:hypothetical protein [Actinomycetota bacterium]